MSSPLSFHRTRRTLRFWRDWRWPSIRWGWLLMHMIWQQKPREVNRKALPCRRVKSKEKVIWRCFVIPCRGQAHNKTPLKPVLFLITSSGLWGEVPSFTGKSQWEYKRQFYHDSPYFKISYKGYKQHLLPFWINSLSPLCLTFNCSPIFRRLEATW